jgi:hypothetical protein
MIIKKDLLEAIEDMPKVLFGDRGLFMRYDTKGLWYCGYDNTTVFASDRELPIALEKLGEKLKVEGVI